jgi:prepilin peptidase CpaA
MNFTVPARGVEVVLLALVLGAAVYDVRYRRIPNWLTAGGILIGVALNTFLTLEKPDRWQGLRSSLLGFALGFGVYVILYALRAMGAGDVKLMAAVGSLVGPGNWFCLFLITAVVGGIMALILAAVRGRVRTTLWNVGFILSEMKRGRPAYLGKEELDVKSPKALGLPHGVVIALGTVFFLAAAAHFAG